MTEINIRFGNCGWQYGGDVPLIQEQASHCNVLALVECRTKPEKGKPAGEPLRIRPIVGDDWWTQQNVSDSAHAGSVTTIRKSAGGVVDTGLDLLSGGNDKVQARYARDTTYEIGGVEVRLLVGHLAKQDSGKHEEGLRRARQLAADLKRWRRKGSPGSRLWVMLFDANMEPDAFLETVRAPNGFGHKPIVAGYSRGWGALHTRTIEVGGWDHHLLSLREAR